MKVLIIGGAGYIGSHVVKALLKKNHEITVFDNLSSGLRQNLFKQCGFIHGDILNPSQLDAAFEQGFDAFIHLAAFKAAGESMIVPEKYALNNINGTINILNAAVKHNCKKMVFSSSAAVLVRRSICQLTKSTRQTRKTFTAIQSLILSVILRGTTSSAA